MSRRLLIRFVDLAAAQVLAALRNGVTPRPAHPPLPPVEHATAPCAAVEHATTERGA